MIHSFNINIATKYGVHSAIILDNLNYWITKNKANEQHFYDGHYWTYNSKKAFAELFPYMTERQIDYALKKLIDDGIIITGKYAVFASVSKSKVLFVCPGSLRLRTACIIAYFGQEAIVLFYPMIWRKRDV